MTAVDQPPCSTGGTGARGALSDRLASGMSGMKAVLPKKWPRPGACGLCSWFGPPQARVEYCRQCGTENKIPACTGASAATAQTPGTVAVAGQPLRCTQCGAVMVTSEAVRPLRPTSSNTNGAAPPVPSGPPPLPPPANSFHVLCACGVTNAAPRGATHVICGACGITLQVAESEQLRQAVVASVEDEQLRQAVEASLKAQEATKPQGESDQADAAAVKPKPRPGGWLRRLSWCCNGGDGAPRQTKADAAEDSAGTAKLLS